MRKQAYVLGMVFFVGAFGYLSAFVSVPICENRTVLVSSIHSEWDCSKLGTEIRRVGNRVFDYSHSREIVLRNVNENPRVMAFLESKEPGVSEKRGQFSVSRGRVVFPYVVAVDNEIEDMDSSCWGFRSYYFVIGKKIYFRKAKIVYTIKTNPEDLNGKLYF